MRITKNQLRKIIKEEISNALLEFGRSPKHRLRPVHKARQIVAWYLSQGNRNRTPHSASDLVDGLRDPDSEEVFRRYGTTHDEMAPHIEGFVEEIIKDVRSGVNPHYPDWHTGEASRSKAMVFDAPGAEEGGDAIVFKGFKRI